MEEEMRLHDLSGVLAIEPETYRRWLSWAIARPIASVDEAEAAARLIPGRKSVGDIAVVALSGFITQKPNMFSMLFGGTSAEQFAREVAAAMRDDTVGAVVLNVDSPGGSVFGVPEAAAAIRALRGSKPMVAVANPIMASAAYHLASQADEVVSSQSGLVGSIGAFALHVDESAALEAAGLKVTEVTYGRRKAEESSIKPLSEDARASMQTRVDYYGKLFEEDVAKGRKTPIATVRSRYGEGAVFVATEAQSVGLVDRIASLDDVITELARGKRPAVGLRAFDEAALRARAALAGVRLED
jgi:signal peptide peptidase SppA